LQPKFFLRPEIELPLLEFRVMHAKDRERLFQTVFESSPDAIFIEDMAGNVLDCNPAAAALHGSTREQLIGKNVVDLVPSEYRWRIAALQANTPPEFEGFSLTADGRSIPVSIRTSHIEYLGQPALVLHVRDISRANEVLQTEIAERSRAEEARARLEREVQGAHKMEAVGRLAGGVAHDFNNLLTVIMGRCEVLLAGLADNHPTRPDVLLIYEAAQKAALVTRQLLAFGRKQVLQPKILNLNAVIGSMETMIRSLISDNVQLTSDLSEGLWTIEADRGQIEQVLMNLVVNALDAMPDGGRLRMHSSNIELDGSPPDFGFSVKSGRYVMFSIQDSGRGMDAEILPHIFEPFFTTKDKTSGSGLGLPTVYGIVKQSGGYVTVVSRPGEGSTFKVYLPGLLAPAEPLEDNARIMVAAHGGETILLAEDSDLVRQLTREMLEVRGYRVLEALDGKDAVHICKTYTGQIDLTLTDVVMPGLTGRELAEQIAELRPNTKVLLMSGYTDEISKAGFLYPGLHFIEKPFTSNALATKIRELLDPPKL
jgi:two-component system, cell cycle sensor histidine kinase and response regulator CckA